MYRDQRRNLEGHGDPGCPLSFFQVRCRVLNIHLHTTRNLLHRQIDLHIFVSGRHEFFVACLLFQCSRIFWNGFQVILFLAKDRIGRTHNADFRDITVEFQASNFSTHFLFFTELYIGKIGGPVREGTGCPANIRKRQAGQHVATANFIRRKRKWNSQHSGLHTGIAGLDPKGRAFADGFHFRRFYRNQFPQKFRRLLAHHSKIRQVRFRTARQKIVDVVPTGIYSCFKRSSRNRRFRRIGSSERAKHAGVCEFLEVGHDPFRHELLQQLWIHSVETEDDHLVFHGSHLRLFEDRKV